MVPHEGLESRSEMKERNVDTVLLDYRTAHTGAGDPDYTQWLPESCTRCWHQAQAAEEQGRPEPTAPDQEWVSDEPT